MARVFMKGRAAHQVIRDDTERDPASRAIRAMVTKAPQTVPSFDHTDTAFTADAPAFCGIDGGEVRCATKHCDMPVDVGIHRTCPRAAWDEPHTR